MIITKTGATNAHMAPLSVSIQQLCTKIGYKCTKIIETLTSHHVHIDHEQLQQK